MEQNILKIDEKKSKMIQFVLIFGLLTISYYTLSSLGYLNSLANYFAKSEVKICGPFLKYFYNDLIYADNYIMLQDFRVNINFGCDGTEPIFIFIFAVLAFPSKIIKKLPALLFGSIIIFIANLIRISSLFYIGLRHHNYMDTFHNDIFPFAIILIEFGIWIYWINWINRSNATQDISKQDI